MSTQTRADDHRVNSPSASVSFHGNIKDIVAAISIIVNVVLGIVIVQEYRAKTTAEDLRRYDLDFFVRNEYQPLKAKVEAHDSLLTFLGCKKE